MIAVALAIHVLGAVIWVGGMFFAYVCLRPVAASLLEPPQRLSLWQAVLARFFRWVWISVIGILLSGHGLIGLYGGMAAVGKHVHIMMLLGYVMAGLYAYVFFGPYRQLTQRVSQQAWPEAAASLNRIRQVVAINLMLGLIVIVVASSGKWWL